MNWVSKLFCKKSKKVEIRIDDELHEVYSEDDYKNFIRETSLKSLLGEIDLKPDISNLNRRTIRRCRKLSDKGMVIGGSVLLKACGLIDRETDDIDVLWDIEAAKEGGIITDKNIVNSWEGYDNCQRYKVKLRWLGEVDIFQKNELEVPNKIDGINWADPIVTMGVKFSYYRTKDHKDFIEVKNKLGIDI